MTSPPRSSTITGWGRGHNRSPNTRGRPATDLSGSLGAVAWPGSPPSIIQAAAEQGVGVGQHRGVEHAAAVRPAQTGRDVGERRPLRSDPCA
jgi:hypothetical protein